MSTNLGLKNAIAYIIGFFPLSGQNWQFYPTFSHKSHFQVKIPILSHFQVKIGPFSHFQVKIGNSIPLSVTNLGFSHFQVKIPILSHFQSQIPLSGLEVTQSVFFAVRPLILFEVSLATFPATIFFYLIWYIPFINLIAYVSYNHST